MKDRQAEEFTEGLAQVFAGAVRLADLAQDIGVPQALGLSPEEWAQRRLAGTVRLSIPERRKVVLPLAEQGLSTREIGEALGVSHQTVANDLNAVKDLTLPNSAEASKADGAVKNLPEGRDRTVLFTSDRDDWETPQELFDLLDAEFRFDVDVCATAELAKCSRYFTPEQDGLAQEWRGACWMNPPYGDEIPRWIAKAHESADEGATVVCLVPARVDTGWWWNHCRHGEVRFVRGRLRFGGGDTSAPFPSAIVIFGRPPRVVWWEAWP